MPRRARRLLLGEYFHVVNRGSVRARIFYDQEDYETFVHLMAEAVERFDLPLLSYCVMPNHWHLITRPKDLTQLSKTLHWLTVTHTVRWRRRHDRRGPGPIYQGRFKAVPIEPGVHLLRACRYVERNALRPNLSERAEEWPWGSANQRCEKRDKPRLEPLQFVQPEGWVRILNERIGDDGVREAVRQNRAIASEDWIQARLAALGLGSLRKPGRPRKNE